MEEILCSEKYEGVDVKYHSTVAFLSLCLKLPKKDNFGPTVKGFFQKILHFGKLKMLKSSMTTDFSSSGIKIAKYGIFSAKVLFTYMKLCMNLNLRA